MMSLSKRLRPDVECAPWVIAAVRELEHYLTDTNARIQFLLDNYVESETGQLTFPDGETWSCKQKQPAEKVMDKTIQTISLSCRHCRQRMVMRDRDGKPVPHSTPDRSVITWFRRHGWSCASTGHNAVCPDCKSK